MHEQDALSRATLAVALENVQVRYHMQVRYHAQVRYVLWENMRIIFHA